MSVSDKIKTLLKVSKKKYKELSIDANLLRGKLQRNSFSFFDVLQLCQDCNARLTITTPDDTVISFTSKDLQESQSKLKQHNSKYNKPKSVKE